MAARKNVRVQFAFAAAGAALMLALAPATARAAEDPLKQEKIPSYSALMKMKPNDVMKMMDVDKGGSVTREEFMKFYESLYERLDRDQNRQITPQEFTEVG
jgi:hypothetical protein